ncbi:MAG: aldehyde dehydrogenase family protein [Ilumatobacteraceae bacterium]
MLYESMRLRLVARGAVNFRTYADLAATYEERHWSSKGTENTVQRMPAGPAVDHHAVERAVHAVDVEGRAGARRRQHASSSSRRSGRRCRARCSPTSPSRQDSRPACFNLVQGIGEEVGPPLVGDPRVRRISFTGSPETARHIGRAAAENIVPFTAELGGKGPLIVFADADLDAAALKAAGQYDDSGQVCLAGTQGARSSSPSVTSSSRRSTATSTSTCSATAATRRRRSHR